MIPKSETPQERIERDIARLKSLPGVMLYTVEGITSLGPWGELDGALQDCVLNQLDWSGVSGADRQRILEREVKPYIFNPFCRSKDEEC